MRQYRGKTKGRSNKWVYGWLVDVTAANDPNSGLRILEQIDGGIVYHPIHPDSVGQYTGLDDKNGKPKYPGDIKKTLCITPEFDEPLTSEPEINNGRFQCDTRVTALYRVIDYVEEITGVEMDRQSGYIAGVEEIYSAFDLPSTISDEEFNECILCHIKAAGFDVKTPQDILDCINIGEVIGNTTDNPELLTP